MSQPMGIVWKAWGEDAWIGTLPLPQPMWQVVVTLDKPASPRPRPGQPAEPLYVIAVYRDHVQTCLAACEVRVAHLYAQDAGEAFLRYTVARRAANTHLPLAWPKDLPIPGPLPPRSEP